MELLVLNNLVRRDSRELSDIWPPMAAVASTCRPLQYKATLDREIVVVGIYDQTAIATLRLLHSVPFQLRILIPRSIFKGGQLFSIQPAGAI
jgi:hypothetical protein